MTKRGSDLWLPRRGERTVESYHESQRVNSDNKSISGSEREDPSSENDKKVRRRRTVRGGSFGRI